MVEIKNSIIERGKAHFEDYNIFKVRKTPVKTYWGTEFDEAIRISNDFVSCMIKVRNTNYYLMVGQWRLGVNKPCNEVVCGIVDDGEDHRHCVKREIEEETGIKVIDEDLQYLTSKACNTAIDSNHMHYYYLEVDVDINDIKDLVEVLTSRQNLDDSEEVAINFTDGLPEMEHGLLSLYHYYLTLLERVNDTPILKIDAYKNSHRQFVPASETNQTILITPRGVAEGYEFNTITAIGMQYVIKLFINDFKKNFFEIPEFCVVNKFKEVLSGLMGYEVSTKDISDLHKLGYLPLEIRSLYEGTVIPANTPIMSIENTIPQFSWLVTYIESYILNSISRMFNTYNIGRKIKETIRDVFISHGLVFDEEVFGASVVDFSYRGAQTSQAGSVGGIGHLINYSGSDNVTSCILANMYYGMPFTYPTTINALEHNVHMKLDDVMGNEYAAFDALINDSSDKFKSDRTKWTSYLIDTVHASKTCEYIISKKEDILRTFKKFGGRFIIRHDSNGAIEAYLGDPNATDDITKHGFYKSLADTFPGIPTKEGLKTMDPAVGFIFGDSLDGPTIKIILDGLIKDGYYPSNLAFGIGSSAYNESGKVRDLFKIAGKLCSYRRLDNSTGKMVEIAIQKNPEGKKSKFKISLKGLPFISNVDGKITIEEGVDRAKFTSSENLLEVRYSGKDPIDNFINWKDLKAKVAFK